jgi:RNA polymerase sigma-70 factor (ECF subfamily)
LLNQASRDEDLVTAIAAGSRSALGELYDRYAPVLVALGRKIVGELREAEDLVHDVFLEIWRQAGDYDASRGSARAWIFLRLRSRALDRRKTPRISRAVALEPEHDRQDASEDPSLGPDRAVVRRALAELPAEQRTVLELGYYHGLSSSEIAERERLPLGTVKSRTAAALARLRAGLGR